MVKLTHYDTLGLKQDATQQDIKKRYQKLVLLLHPDKNSDVSPELFMMVQKAYEVLGNETARQEYDYYLDKHAQDVNSAHLVLKQQYNDFVPTVLKSRDVAREQFNKENSAINNNNGYNPKVKETKYTDDDIRQRMAELMESREQEEIEYTTQPIFDDPHKFDSNKFNAMFEFMANQNNNQIVEQTTLSGFSDMKSSASIMGGNNFMELDKDTSFNQMNMVPNVDIQQKQQDTPLDYDAYMQKYKDDTARYRNQKLGDFDMTNQNELTKDVKHLIDIYQKHDDNDLELQDACDDLLTMNKFDNLQ